MRERIAYNNEVIYKDTLAKSTQETLAHITKLVRGLTFFLYWQKAYSRHSFAGIVYFVWGIGISYTGKKPMFVASTSCISTRRAC